MSISHQQAQKWIREFAGGSANPRAEGRLAEHLDACVECRAYAAELAAFEQQIAGSLKEHWQRPGLSNYEVRAITIEINRQARQRRRLARWQALLRSLALAGSAAAVILALGWAIQAKAPWLGRLFPAPTVETGASTEPAAAPTLPYQELPFLKQRPPAVLQGQPLPETQAKITPENASQLAPLALWGQDSFSAMALSPDGQEVAALSPASGRVFFYNSQTLTETGSVDMGRQESCTQLAYAPDGRRLAVGCDAHLQIWRLPEKKLLHNPVTGPVGGLAFAPDGSYLASAQKTTVQLWNDQGENILAIDADQPVAALAVSPDGQVIATGDQSGAITLWQARDGQRIRSWAAHPNWVYRLAFSPDGATLVSTGGDAYVKMWNPLDGTLQRQALVDDWGSDLAFSPNGRLLVVGRYRLYRLVMPDGNLVEQSWAGSPMDAAANLTFTSDGEALLLRSDNRIYRLLTADWSLAAQSQQPLSRLTALALSPDNHSAATGTADHGVQVWRVSDGGLLHTLTGQTEKVTALAFSPDGALLASGSLDGTVRIWGLQSARESAGQIDRRIAAGQRVRCLAFAPDGLTLATGGSDGKVHLWRLADARRLLTVEIGLGDVTSLDFSPDGSLLVIGSGQNTITLASAAGGAVVRQWQEGQSAFPGHIAAVRFTPDGREVAASYRDGEYSYVKIWRVTDGAVLRAFQTYNLPDSPLAFSPDGRLAAYGNFLFRVEDGAVAAVLPNWGQGPVFSGDGKLLLNFTSGGVWVWGIP